VTPSTNCGSHLPDVHDVERVVLELEGLPDVADHEVNIGRRLLVIVLFPRGYCIIMSECGMKEQRLEKGY
jgi:hypothetical protein